MIRGLRGNSHTHYFSIFLTKHTLQLLIAHNSINSHFFIIFQISRASLYFIKQVLNQNQPMNSPHRRKYFKNDLNASSNLNNLHLYPTMTSKRVQIFLLFHQMIWSPPPVNVSKVVERSLMKLSKRSILQKSQHIWSLVKKRRWMQLRFV